MRLSSTSVVLVSSVVAGSGDASAEQCLEYGGAEAIGELGDKRLDEASGMVSSATQTDVLWAHNDSGADPRLHALDLAGERLARVDVMGADAVDWEDIALGPCATAGTRDCLFIADTGNNDGDRDDQTIYRVAEPDVSGADATEAADAMRVVIPDGADVEALFVDERGALWLVAKRDDDAVLYNVGVFRVDGEVDAVAVGTRSDIAFVTGADATGDGTRIVLRSSEVAWELFRAPGVSVEEAFLGSTLEVALANEEQGESIAFAPDGSGFYTTSEGEGATLSWYPCVRFAAPIVVNPEVTPDEGAETTPVTEAEVASEEVTPVEAVVVEADAVEAEAIEADAIEADAIEADAIEGARSEIDVAPSRKSEGCAGGSAGLGALIVLVAARRRPDGTQPR